MTSPLAASALIAAVRRNGMFGPENGDAFPLNEDIQAWLNEEMPLCLTPLLMKPREERFVAVTPFDTTVDVSKYPIPSRSVWSDIRDVQVLIPGSSPEAWVSLFPTPPEQASQPWGWCWSWTAAYPAGYYVEADQIVLVPPPPQVWTMRIKWFRRPAQIVSSGCSDFTGHGSTTPTYRATVDSTTGMVDGLFDLVAAESPFLPVMEDLEFTVEDATTLRSLNPFTTDQITLLNGYATDGGYQFVAAECSPYAQIPADLAPLLSTRATYRALQAKQSPLWENWLRSAEMLEKKLLSAMTPRADGLPQHVVVTNAPGLGNGGGWNGGWGSGGFGGA